MYKPVEQKTDFPKMEEAILTFWKEHNIFQKSLENRKDAPEFSFYDGPPFATGLPHFGHLVPGTIKDIIPRYQTMKGKLVNRRFGWDCHGLPVEYEMEKELKISGKREIEEYGIAKFNENCRSIVLRYTKQWEKTITRMGRWVDFENDYKTMDPNYMESIWYIFKQLWEKGLIYQGNYILPYCPRCTTPLSNHELNLGGYKDVHDPAITVAFQLEDQKDSYFLAWTTTPWTLPSNLALALGPDIDYVKVKDSDVYYILAKSRLSAYYKNEDLPQIIEEYKGKDLLGISYIPLFPYFSERKAFGAFKTFNADYVSTEDGTGIVHIASGFGEDDYAVLKETKIVPATPIDSECKFTDEVKDFQGRFVKDCDKDIIERLRQEGKLIKRENYLHSYPHCWRCKSPLIYRAVGSWFVDISKIKKQMISANEHINWVPSHLQQGRFGKWLENAREWSISRNRYWGNPIPVWKCDSCGKLHCVGSKGELQELSGLEITDLHKHFVDDITFACLDKNCNGTMHRVSEVLDCWFESGSMPYAQNHYPFENKQRFESNFPADFIAEGLDQTRGWFYTLTVLAAALFDKPAFKNVVVNGLVLASDGKKMSKSERNYSDPNDVINQFGADALRIFLMNSAVVRGEDLKFSDEGVLDVVKSILIPLWSGSYYFYITYANIDNIKPEYEPENLTNPMDIWITSECEKLIELVGHRLDNYDLQAAITPIVEFIDNLNNWYIRRSRQRFWKAELDQDKQNAYSTLYTVLLKLILCSAPFMPFITEEIYQNLKTPDMPLSIHLCDFPISRNEKRDLNLEKKMDIIRKTVSMGRALRITHSIKVKQPLKTLYLVTKDKEEKAILYEMQELIQEELNIKEVLFKENEEELVEYRAKANFKVLGKILGAQMKVAAPLIEKINSHEIQSIIDGSTLSIDVPNFGPLELTKESILVSRLEKDNLHVLNEGSLTIALDTHITKDLLLEGYAREIIRSIQNFRKESELKMSDRISLDIELPDELKEAFLLFSSHICKETLCDSFTLNELKGSTEIQCGTQIIKISLAKI